MLILTSASIIQSSGVRAAPLYRKMRRAGIPSPLLSTHGGGGGRWSPWALRPCTLGVFFAEGEVLRTPWAGVLGHTEDGWPPAVSVPSESGGCPSSRPICRSLTGRDGWRSPPPTKKKKKNYASGLCGRVKVRIRPFGTDRKFASELGQR